MIFKDNVFELFEGELHKRNLRVKRKDYNDDVYIIEINGEDQSFYLGNVRRDFERCKDPEIIADFVAHFVNFINMPPNISNFNDLRDKIRFSLESCEFEIDDFIHEKISDNVFKVIVFVDEDENGICWIRKSCLEDWKVAKDELTRIADENMSKLLDEFDLEIKDAEGMKLAMFLTTPPLIKKRAFKASLIACSKFKNKVIDALGWPVFSVIPTRDFVYVIPETDKDLLNMVGKIVVDEFNESAYPITAEVFLISDEGVKAIGSYQEGSGAKTI